MFTPNTTCQWLKKTSRRTLTGKDQYEPARPVPCGIVRLDANVAPTTVRSDSSASRGAATQTVAAAKLLFPPRFAISNGDVLIVRGVKIEVVGVQPRLDVIGKLDHNEVTGEIKADV